MKKPIQRVDINEQDDDLEVFINGHRILEISNRMDEGFIEIHVYDTEKRQVLNQAFDADVLSLFEESTESRPATDA